MEKENVLELKTRTEQGKEEGAKQVAEKGSTVAGKFKDVNALLTAYGALEAEFTRRSQRLKELERKLAEKEDGTEKSVDKVEAEKPKENSGSEGVSAEEAVESAVEPVTGDGREIAEESSEQKSAVSGSLEGKRDDARGDDADGPCLNGAGTDGGFVGHTGDLTVKTESDDELYQKANANENVRLKIIGEYLSSLSQSNAPLTRGGRGTVMTPTQKAKSVTQAGTMALQYFQKGK